MLLGNRSRPPMNRTTSIKEIDVDLSSSRVVSQALIPWHDLKKMKGIDGKLEWSLWSIPCSIYNLLSLNQGNYRLLQSNYMERLYYTAVTWEENILHWSSQLQYPTWWGWCTDGLGLSYMGLVGQLVSIVPWCMLFVDDIVLVDESRDGVNVTTKLVRWREAL